ncbi:MAG: PilZ domain-containing protein [Planctomycetota bacterium]
MARLRATTRFTQTGSLVRMAGAGDTRRVTRVEPHGLWSNMGRVVDLSSRGAQVVSQTRPRPVGDWKQILIEIPEGRILVFARTVWIRHDPSGFRFGLEFAASDETARLQLTDLCAGVRAARSETEDHDDQAVALELIDAELRIDRILAESESRHEP